MSDERSIEQLLGDLQSEDWHVQRRAADRLGEIGDETVLKAVVAVSDFPPGETEGILSAPRSIVKIVMRVGVAALDSVIDIMKDEDLLYRASRSSIRDALKVIGEPAVAPLISILIDKSWHRLGRVEAATTLAEIGSLQAIESLMAILNRSDDTILQDWITRLLISEVGTVKAIAAVKAWRKQRNL